MFILDQQPLRDLLLALRPNANTAFTQSLHPGIDNVLGLRFGAAHRQERPLAGLSRRPGP